MALRQRLQPQAVTFGGCAAMPVNSVAWVGTESGHAPYPLWCENRIFCAMLPKLIVGTKIGSGQNNVGETQ